MEILLPYLLSLCRAAYRLIVSNVVPVINFNSSREFITKCAPGISSTHSSLLGWCAISFATTNDKMFTFGGKTEIEIFILSRLLHVFML